MASRNPYLGLCYAMIEPEADISGALENNFAIGTGGESGTIRNYYKSDAGMPPYVYAKTGTLSMSNALSGYLFTKSGKILMFSFLLNNYTLPSNDLKKEMEKVLYTLHSRY